MNERNRERRQDVIRLATGMMCGHQDRPPTTMTTAANTL